ncbi:unnamed protein product [Candidula unifasciata]|uniref:Palmitoyltransferase n=1 Tax=Candidula unifasciata TaxID=100452 RepID=A0A8S3Z2J5_9EUPU|nr:unnamed protein product [Candidula unifasciata]
MYSCQVVNFLTMNNAINVCNLCHRNIDIMLHLPCHPKEWFLFGLFWLGGVWTIIYECCIVVWYYHQHCNWLVISHIVTVTLLACLIYSNMYFLLSKDVSARQLNRCQETCPPGWTFCKQCQFHVPPRSHHCKLCNLCILKRDHHCWFAGYCIGFKNHRYFVSLAFYMSIAGLYANIYNWQFVLNEKGGFTWTTLPSLFAPHVGLMLGYYSLYEFALTVNTSVGFFFTIFFVWMFCVQVLQIISGQVMHERKKGIHVYNLGFRTNLQEVFGPRGLISLLCPFVPTQLAGDGTEFSSHTQKTE